MLFGLYNPPPIEKGHLRFGPKFWGQTTKYSKDYDIIYTDEGSEGPITDLVIAKLCLESQVNQNQNNVNPQLALPVLDLVPFSVEMFQLVLKFLLHGVGHYTNLGVVLAVTNKSQTVAASHLKETGFKSEILPSKMSLTTEPNCTLWVGNYWNNLKPIFDKTNEDLIPNEDRPLIYRKAVDLSKKEQPNA
jgi:hypothetical protein